MDVYGLIGDPVEHSLSPPMHEAAYEVLGIDAVYCLFPVEEDVETAVRGAEKLGLMGLNVTIPHKRAVSELDFVEADELAAKIGAANTLSFEPSGIKAYNTDAIGARKALESHEVSLTDSRVVILGAGGAARGIAFALADTGASLSIVNRTEEKAHELASDVSEFGGVEAIGYPFEDSVVENQLTEADVLVNATSVGMKEDVSPVSSKNLHSELAVFDVVYTPLETRLLKDAKKAGAKTIDGAWMLVYQGAESFEIWTGEEAPVDEMNAALRKEIGSSED